MPTPSQALGFWTRLNHLPDLVRWRWFWILVFGFSLTATVVLPMVVVTSTALNLRLAGWVAWAVLLGSTAAVWAISRWLVPPRPRAHRADEPQLNP